MKKIIPLLVLVLILGACGQSAVPQNKADETEKVEVYTTVYPLTYFTERIGGERVNVNSVYPAGANEHTFEPTQKDMIALAEADLMFYVGLGLEGFIDNAKKTLENESVKFVATADAITDEELESGGVHEAHEEETHDEESHEEHEHEDEAHEDEHEAHEEEHGTDSHEGHNHGDTDPHVWISPVLSQKLALSIKDSLTQADPEGAETYDANYTKLISELKKLDQSFADLSERVTNKTFFVSHSAFGYIAEPYGFEQISVAGLNSQDEPSQKELTKIVDLAKEKNINYIIFEQNVSSKLTEVIQNEVGAEALQMHNLGVLTQENIDNNETYFTLMEKNLQVLETALK
ncbi:zinc transport system substrate-binding protein [Planomicrobium soli]|uniref:Zinc transport system substrate-binding protein n=1 Tax=Planomicrobium soli TaxID=1176648 RepID=A0A2P8GB49_9BACL|nr:zinc ABC transporter substrate-binding protein [Planomicrobium soli]PSL31125.1 zinc transport system substrate-binding protein [Planomicrobium soli]